MANHRKKGRGMVSVSHPRDKRETEIETEKNAVPLGACAVLRICLICLGLFAVYSAHRAPLHYYFSETSETVSIIGLQALKNCAFLCPIFCLTFVSPLRQERTA